MDQVRDMHESILGNIEHVQEQTARILAEQERDLLRAFRARLFDVQTELEKEKTRAQEGSSVRELKGRRACCGEWFAMSAMPPVLFALLLCPWLRAHTMTTATAPLCPPPPCSNGSSATVS